jgi:hypothetical protein
MAPRPSGKVQRECWFWQVAGIATQAPLIRPRQYLPDQSSSLVLKAQRDVDVAQSLHLDFAFLFAVPVGDPVRLDLDEHDVRRVDALVEPTV